MNARILLLLVWALALPVAAQTPEPEGAPMEQPGDEPGVDTARPVQSREEGTTLVGERESPIGLYLTPWKNSQAEQDIDRPARLLQEEMLPIDEDVFIRNLEYYEALSGALKRKNAVTPPVPTTP